MTPAEAAGNSNVKDLEGQPPSHGLFDAKGHSGALANQPETGPPETRTAGELGGAPAAETVRSDVPPLPYAVRQGTVKPEAIEYYLTDGRVPVGKIVGRRGAYRARLESGKQLGAYPTIKAADAAILAAWRAGAA